VAAPARPSIVGPTWSATARQSAAERGRARQSATERGRARHLLGLQLWAPLAPHLNLYPGECPPTLAIVHISFSACMLACLCAWIFGTSALELFFHSFWVWTQYINDTKGPDQQRCGGPQHTPAHTTTPKPTQTHTNTLTRMCKNKKFVLFREIILLLFLNIHF
jgi:hypothetical protein